MANNTRLSADLTTRAHEFNNKYPQEIYDAIRSVTIYNPDFHHEAPSAVRERLKWMNEVLAANEASTFIAGAWGRQDPEFMAKAMIEELTYPQTLVFAIPKGRNYDVFDKVAGREVSCAITHDCRCDKRGCRNPHTDPKIKHNHLREWESMLNMIYRMVQRDVREEEV